MKKLNREWGVTQNIIPHSPLTTPYSPFPTPHSPLPFQPLRLCVSFFSIILVVFFVSCATAPKASPVLEDGSPDFSILPSGADLYLWADVKNAKPLIDALSFGGLKGSDASRIAEYTDTVLAALYPEQNPDPALSAAGGEPRPTTYKWSGSAVGSGQMNFFLAGIGNYPKSKAGFSMSISRDWKKIKSETGNRYWFSKSHNLGVALGSKLVFVSEGDPFVLGSGINPAPKDFEEFRRSTVLSGWLNNPGISLNRFIESLGIPLQIPAEELYFGVVKIPLNEAVSNSDGTSQKPWELVFKIKTSSAREARSVLSLFTFARMFIPRNPAGGERAAFFMSPMEAAALLFANPPEQEEEFLTLRLPPLNEKSIALLLGMFQGQL